VIKTPGFLPTIWGKRYNAVNFSYGGNNTLTSGMFPIYHSFLERVLTPPRLRHSLGVMHVMEELADVYGLDREKAQEAGLLHDAGKDLTSEQQVQLIKEGGIEIHYPEETDYTLYMHGPVGAYFVRKELGVSDTLILDAIAMHTFCGSGMHWDDPLVWCLRFSDLLEPNRNWSSVSWLRQEVPNLRVLAYSGQMAKAARLQTGMLIEWFDTVGYPVHPHMRRAYREFSFSD
jgi:predicted HD superfamily hydrolase involved in NAD metabolism